MKKKKACITVLTGEAGVRVGTIPPRGTVSPGGVVPEVRTVAVGLGGGGGTGEARGVVGKLGYVVVRGGDGDGHAAHAGHGGHGVVVVVVRVLGAAVIWGERGNGRLEALLVLVL